MDLVLERAFLQPVTPSTGNRYSISHMLSWWCFSGAECSANWISMLCNTPPHRRQSNFFLVVVLNIISSWQNECAFLIHQESALSILECWMLDWVTFCRNKLIVDVARFFHLLLLTLVCFTDIVEISRGVTIILECNRICRLWKLLSESNETIHRLSNSPTSQNVHYMRHKLYNFWFMLCFVVTKPSQLSSVAKQPCR